MQALKPLVPVAILLCYLSYSNRNQLLFYALYNIQRFICPVALPPSPSPVYSYTYFLLFSQLHIALWFFDYSPPHLFLLLRFPIYQSHNLCQPTSCSTTPHTSQLTHSHPLAKKYQIIPEIIHRLREFCSHTPIMVSSHPDVKNSLIRASNSQ